ncbi:MAG TPA: restriction endonuclease subunit S [Marinilabiliaceae bacterium]|nr:restriction endonuclease subunit S [Marinilabiliaceae bacterium]
MDKWPERWKVFALSEICEVKDGTHDSPKFQLSGFPLVTSKNLRNNNIDLSHVKFISQNDYDSINKRSKVEKGDILFAMIGTIGNPVLIKEEPRFAIKNIALFKKSEHVIPDFLVYFLGSNRTLDRMISEAKGATQKFVGLGYLRKFSIPLPPLPEQKRIVSKLDALFERIDQSIALLEENIKNTEALMASALDEVFTSTTRRVSISDLIEKTKNINPKQNPNQEFTYIDITSINNKTHIIEDPKFVKGEDAPSRARKGVEYGDILFATTRPNLRNIAVINKSYNNPVASTGFCVLRVKKGINSDFVFNCLLSNEIQKQITPFIRGAQYPAISDKNLTSCKVPALEFKEQNAIAKKIKFLREKAIELQKEQQGKLNNLKALKESILDKAFKGEL